MGRDESQHSDWELICAAQAGDLRAFERLIERYDERVLTLVWCYTASEEDKNGLLRSMAGELSLG